MIHVGLIGAGNISGTHARAVEALEDAKIVAVYGANREKAERLANAHAAMPFSDFDSFLRHRPMDMVIIGTPSGLHAQQGIAAAEHGLHVLTEKPVDISTQRADELIAACDQARVRCGVIFQERFQPINLRLKQRIASGALGRILLANAHVHWYRAPEYYTASRWHGTRALDGGGALMNQGVHTVDFLLWLLGDVTNVQAQTATLLHKMECEDTALAILTFANGALGTLQVTTAAYPGYERRLEITGTEGTIILEGERIVAADLHSQSGAPLQADEQQGSAERASSAAVSDIRGHKAAIETFIRAVRDGAPLECDAREGRRSLALIERIYQAALSHPCS